MGTYQHVLLAVDFSKEADHVGTRAVALADRMGIAVIGYVRAGTFIVYAGKDAVVSE